MKTTTIRQTAMFKVAPEVVYETLMDSRRHCKFAGGKCSISREVGGKFSISDGYIKGENHELVPNKKIVQLWQADEECWPKDHYSKVTFALEKVKMGTRLKFTQTGIPAECGDRFVSGWKDYYWAPMKEMLEG